MLKFYHALAYVAVSIICLVHSGPMEKVALPIASLPVNSTNLTSHRVISKHLIGGNIAYLGQIPWQAAIKIAKYSGHYFCGGSLIHEKWILTAGHCTLNASRFDVFLGTLRPYSSDTRLISRLAFTHPGFNGTNMNDDIGLISLPVPVNISANIKVIEIATNVVSSNLFISGWGKMNEDTKLNKSNGVVPDLQFAPVRLIKRRKCAATFGLRVVSSSTLCTQGKRSPCSGDSGGPLASWGPTPQLVGIVSFIAASGCERGLPAGYVRVSSFREWIRNVTGLLL